MPEQAGVGSAAAVRATRGSRQSWWKQQGAVNDCCEDRHKEEMRHSRRICKQLRFSEIRYHGPRCRGNVEIDFSPSPPDRGHVAVCARAQVEVPRSTETLRAGDLALQVAAPLPRHGITVARRPHRRPPLHRSSGCSGGWRRCDGVRRDRDGLDSVRSARATPRAVAPSALATAPRVVRRPGRDGAGRGVGRQKRRRLPDGRDRRSRRPPVKPAAPPPPAPSPALATPSRHSARQSPGETAPSGSRGRGRHARTARRRGERRHAAEHAADSRRGAHRLRALRAPPVQRRRPPASRERERCHCGLGGLPAAIVSYSASGYL